ncbi:helix-turn-helix domain-containing protein [Francisella philomiragia]|uniref:helix-turn-helix domain-containing protein n=1 Tax=Francisella philomiragia TaxID=28110 RepID=UPI0035144FA6
MKSKTQMILEHLQRGDTLSTWEAIQLYKSTRLPAVVKVLSNRGYQIENISPSKNRFGVYRLIKSKNNQTQH